MASMPPVKLWPGQEEVVTFDLAQLKSLSSIARSEVFWAFSATDPQSTTDIAAAISRTAPTVRYHVNELVKANMLVVAGTRKRRSRTEELYVQKFHWGYTKRPPYDAEYMEEINRGFGAICRAMDRERAAATIVGNMDLPFYEKNHFVHAFIKLGPEKAKELSKRLRDLVSEYDKMEDEGEDVLHISTFFAPVLQVSQRRYRDLTGEELSPANTTDETE